ncbi:MazG nucleotide pyrophosphohydrolase domain-containing protein [Streptomonospora wellingtoniae]|uniref:MazG nucleotide pyrophosphohydrolase domain-containing protein n=1 Tax=Streptomonospora wellingtoniae TaxID=3075544 RepID=A0ABU2KUG2_9ACTN|nr:MazG nucleotide pyrophosphohydrolase domain-containing protein [Streptomonospora sp. DSM 45055]MDT0302929.1 MazG nucleotide pyrophosphohydrolase domain-containing protein [Streptomonospora sp. DSM 45055]
MTDRAAELEAKVRSLAHFNRMYHQDRTDAWARIEELEHELEQARESSTATVVARLFEAMGIDGQSPRECVAHLCEEVGELAKATRTGDRANLAEEVGDVGILLHRIAALYGVDVDQAIREKAASRLERHHNTEGADR